MEVVLEYWIHGTFADNGKVCLPGAMQIFWTKQDPKGSCNINLCGLQKESWAVSSYLPLGCGKACGTNFVLRNTFQKAWITNIFQWNFVLKNFGCPKRIKTCSCLGTTSYYKSSAQTFNQLFRYVTKACRAR